MNPLSFSYYIYPTISWVSSIKGNLEFPIIKDFSIHFQTTIASSHSIVIFPLAYPDWTEADCS